MSRATLLALLVVSITAPVAAQDAPRVGLLDTTGRRGRVATRTVQRALEARGEVVNVDGDPATPAAVASEAEVDAILVLRLRGRRLRLTLFDASGEERASETHRVTLGARGRRALRAALDGLFDEAGPLAGASAAPQPESEREAQSEGAAPAAAPSRPTAARSPRRSSGSLRPWLRVRTGISLRNRVVSIRTAAGIDLEQHLPMYPEVLGELEVRPLAIAGDPYLSGVLARVRFAYALFFESETPSAQVVGGSSWNVEGDLGWLVPFDDWVELGIVAGGGYTSYEVDPNPYLGAVAYAHFDTRAVIRIRALAELFVLRSEVGYRLSLGSGPLADSHGDLTGHGVVFSAGVGGVITLEPAIGLEWGVDLDWLRSSLSFEGAAAPEPAVSGAEEMLRARMTIGVAVQ